MARHNEAISFTIRYQDVEKHANLRALSAALSGARLQGRDSLNLAFSVPERLAYRPGSKLFWMRRGWLRIDRVESGEMTLSYALETVPLWRILALLLLPAGIVLAGLSYLWSREAGQALAALAASVLGSLLILTVQASFDRRTQARFKALLRRQMYDLSRGEGDESGWQSTLKEIYSDVYPRK